MKCNILKLSTVILLFVFISAGCQKDDIFEIQIGDGNAVIEHEVNGIEFKFCLLNEQGEPSTIFEEGENFTFQFTVKNNRDEEIYFDTSVTNTKGFCEVQSESHNFDSPYIKPTFDNLRMPSPIKKGDTSVRNIKWIPDENEWTLGLTYFIKANTEYLQKGIYFVEFSHAFDFDTIKTKQITFKINFEIK